MLLYVGSKVCRIEVEPKLGETIAQHYAWCIQDSCRHLNGTESGRRQAALNFMSRINDSQYSKDIRISVISLLGAQSDDALINTMSSASVPAQSPQEQVKGSIQLYIDSVNQEVVPSEPGSGPEKFAYYIDLAARYLNNTSEGRAKASQEFLKLVNQDAQFKDTVKILEPLTLAETDQELINGMTGYNISGSTPVYNQNANVRMRMK